MLCLTRLVGQSILIGDAIEIKFLKQDGRKITLGIDAPRELHIIRTELQERKDHYEADTT